PLRDRPGSRPGDRGSLQGSAGPDIGPEGVAEEAAVMARKVRVRRTQAAIAEANAITAAARAADAELYRDECSVCGRTIPKEFVLSGQSTRTTCGGRFSMRRRSWLRRWRCW